MFHVSLYVKIKIKNRKTILWKVLSLLSTMRCYSVNHHAVPRSILRVFHSKNPGPLTLHSGALYL